MKTCPNCHKPLASNAPDGLCPECLVKAGLPTGVDITDPTGPHGTKVLKPPPTLDEIARHFPQFEILECLGRGGMGVVYKARQPKLNRIVALKILAPEKVAETKFAERFEREAQALARLNHPNIVTVYDFGDTDGLYYLLMEFVDGASLRQLIRTRKLTPQEALAIVPKICEALQFAHDKGVVHRDIKPENVLVDTSGQVKIADFGIAKIVGTEQPLSRPADALSPSGGERAGVRGAGSLTQDQVLGTPHYMAPEQVEKPQTVDHRADIYSLGVVFYEMLTGELPLGKFQPPSKKVQVDVRLDEVVLHALEKEPERRYQHVSEVKSDVETIATTPPSGSSRREEAQTAKAATGSTETKTRRSSSHFRGPPMVVVRDGERVIYWPGVWLYAFLLAGCFAVSWLVAVALLSPFGTPHIAGLVGGIIGFVAAGLALGFYRSFRMPIDRLRKLDPSASGSVQNQTTSNAARGARSLPTAEFERARRLVRIPAIGMMVISILTLGYLAVRLPFWIYYAALSLGGSATDMPWVVVIPKLLVPAGCNIVALEGARRMRQLRSYSWAVVGSIVFLLSPWLLLATYKFQQNGNSWSMPSAYLDWAITPSVLLWLLFGIWSLIVLARREVREAFGKPHVRSPENAPAQHGGASPIGTPATSLSDGSAKSGVTPSGLKLVWIAVIAVLALLLSLPGYKLLVDKVRIRNSRVVASPTPTFAPAIRRLPTGITVELIGLSESPSAGRPWWRPDGSPLTTPPYDRQSGKVFPGRDEVGREFAVRLDHLPAQAITTEWKIEPSITTAGGGSEPLKSETRLANIRAVAVTVPAKSQTATVRFGVGVGAWKDVATGTGIGDTTISTSSGAVMFTPAVEKDGGMLITVTHNHSCELRVVARGKDGRVHESARTSTSSAGSLHQITTTFANLSRERVRQFVLQTRAGEWAEFRNVALNPKSTVATGKVTAPVDAPTFGPVIERVVNDSHAKEGNNALDLDSGQFFTLPEPRKADLTWMLKNGIDAVCAMDGTASQGLAATGGTVAQQIPNDRWETIAAGEVISTVLHQKPDFGGGTCLVDKEAAMGKPTLPVTFVFRTREGATGVLQVLAHNQNPRGVKIRYKLVQGASSPITPNVGPDPAAAFQLCPALKSADQTLGQFIAKKDAPGALAWMDHTMKPQVDAFMNYLTGTDLEQRTRLMVERFTQLRRVIAEGDWKTVKILNSGNPDQDYQADLQRLARKNPPDAESLFAVLHKQVKPGDSIQRVQELLGQGQPPRNPEKNLATARKISTRYPQNYPDGAKDGDQFLVYVYGSLVVDLQFRDGRLINFNPKEYETLPLMNIGGPSPSDRPSKPPPR